MTAPHRTTPRRTVVAVVGGLTVLSAAALTGVALVGGTLPFATAAAVVAAAALPAARWTAGGGAVDRDDRRRTHLVTGTEPTLGEWEAALHDALLTDEGYGLRLHARLLRLYEVRLAERHGLSLRGDPDGAAALIGPELWPWLDPSLPRTPRARRLAREGRAAGPDVPAPSVPAPNVSPRGVPAPPGRGGPAAPPAGPMPPTVLDALITRLEDL